MVAIRKPRMEPTKATPRDRPNAGPQWQSPRTPLPQPPTSQRPRQTCWKRRRPSPKDPDQNVVAALIIAQALDRLGDKLVESAAVGRYRGV